MKKLKILELTNFSAGICGVWIRVREEAVRLAKKGHEVKVFSSNLAKGSNQIALPEEKIGKVRISRFPSRKIGGESFMKWNFEKEAIKFRPDIIIAHSYRHMHTTEALKIAKKIGCKVFLVTHAPFGRDSTRSFLAKIVVLLYDALIGPKTINHFDKIIAITNWEIPYLLKLGANKSKIEYVPNGIPIEFFTLKKKIKTENKILFLGRVSPIKSIETVLYAMPLFKDNNLTFEIIGPAEQGYLSKLKSLIKRLNIEKRVVFSKPIYDIREKIRKIDSASIFILPSKSEGMPQGLIEAMARGSVVIASDIPASRDLIKNGKNGLLFPVGNNQKLAEKIDIALTNNLNTLTKETRKSVEKFSWDKIITRLERLF